MSPRLVRTLLLRSVIQSNGGDSKFLKTLWLIFLGLLSYSCLYLDIAFFTHSLVNLVVIFLASSFAILAILARFSIQVLYRLVSFGGGGMLIYVWFINSSIIGCICQFGLFFIVYMAFLRRWYVVSCFFYFF